VSQSSEFCRHNLLKGTVTSSTKGERIFRYGLSPETFGYYLCITYAAGKALLYKPGIGNNDGFIAMNYGFGR
jgi:hypothetical protein